MKNLVVRRIGLGDAVAAIAQPIAGTIDRATGSRLVECPGCKKRRKDWNKFTVGLPFLKPSKPSDHA